MFAYNTANSASLHSAARIYSCKIYDNGVLVRDFVPAKGNTSGSIGLYDFVEGKFYPNAGTGAFSYGSDISTTDVSHPVVVDGTVYGMKGGKFMAGATVYNITGGKFMADATVYNIAFAVPLSAVPSQSNTLTYNGSAQSPAWANYDSSKMTLGGTGSGTNAGSYTATFTPKSGYCWPDGSTATKYVTWNINKAARTITLSKTRLGFYAETYENYNGQYYPIEGYTADNITVTYTGPTASLRASCDDTSVATCSVTGANTINVRGVTGAKAKTNLTVTVSEDANYASASAVCVVSMDYWNVVWTSSAQIQGGLGTTGLTRSGNVWVGTGGSLRAKLVWNSTYTNMSWYDKTVGNSYNANTPRATAASSSEATSRGTIYLISNVKEDIVFTVSTSEGTLPSYPEYGITGGYYHSFTCSAVGATT